LSVLVKKSAVEFGQKKIIGVFFFPKKCVALPTHKKIVFSFRLYLRAEKRDDSGSEKGSKRYRKLYPMHIFLALSEFSVTSKTFDSGDKMSSK